MSEDDNRLAEHLREVARLPVRGDKLALAGTRLVVGSLHAKAPHELSLVELDEPRVASSIAYKRQIQAVAVVGELAYVFEYMRAIHLVHLDGASAGEAFDCHLMFKREIYGFAPVGSKWLACARHWDGISVLDVSDPHKPRETAITKLGESFVEAVAVAGERVFACAHQDGLVELRIAEDGTLVEVARYLGGEDGFTAQQAFVVGDKLWLFGNGTLPYTKPEREPEPHDHDEHDDDEEVYEAPDGDPDCVVFALTDLTTPLWFGETNVQPKQMRALPDGGAIAIESYRCFRFPALGKPEVLFTFEFPEVTAWLVVGNQLLIQRAKDLAFYEIATSSPLAQL